MGRFVNFGFNAILGVAVLYPILGATQSIIVESEEGETYVLEVNADDSFSSVVEQIHALVDQQEEGRREHCDPINLNLSSILNLKVVSDLRSNTTQFAKKPRSGTRSYAAGVSKSDGEDIAYIVKTLANSSLPRIKTAESSLKKAGDRIDAVHPLQFLLCLFTNEELKVAIRNLNGRTWVWKNFLGGLTDTLEEENGKGNILPYLTDFAARINVDVNGLLALQQTGRWEKFVVSLIEMIPRDPGSGRYNQ